MSKQFIVGSRRGYTLIRERAERKPSDPPYEGVRALTDAEAYALFKQGTNHIGGEIIRRPMSQ